MDLDLDFQVGREFLSPTPLLIGDRVSDPRGEGGFEPPPPLALRAPGGDGQEPPPPLHHCIQDWGRAGKQVLRGSRARKFCLSLRPPRILTRTVLLMKTQWGGFQ